MHATIKLGLPAVLLFAMGALASYMPVVSAGEPKELVNVGNGLCLGARHISDRRWITLTEECGGPQQNWYIEPIEDYPPYIFVEGFSHGKCLDEGGGYAFASKCATTLYTFGQFWVREEISPGSRAARYRAGNSNRYLTSRANGGDTTTATLGTTEAEQALQIWLD